MSYEGTNETYYDILHVQQNAPAPIIKNAYRALMMSMKQHPDLGGDSERAALINLAYETLSDESKRAEYDQTLSKTAGQKESQNSPKQETEQDQAEPRRSYSKNQSQPQYMEGARCAFCYRFHNAPSSELLDCAGCGSPLDPPLSGLNSQSAERSIDRVPKNSQIQITPSIQSPVITAKLKDLSPQGLGFVATTPLSQFQVVKVGCAGFEGVANIVHRRELDSGEIFYGAKFVTLRFNNQAGNFISTKL